MGFKELNKQSKIFYITALLLVIPAVFLNLGLLALWADEPTRAIVALEMMLSDNYIVSTINGEFYYNKPPLYNWILLLFYKLFGSTSELITRLPSVIPYLAFGYTIYYYVKKHLGNWKVGFFSAMAFVTGGNVLFFSSFQGHIDMLYSLITFIGFMVIYEELEKKRWYRLFIITYIITAAGFMMKGMPSLLFQGFTLLAYFMYKREFKKLFHPAHFIGFGIMALLLGTYFYAYQNYNELVPYINTLWSQSEQRTAISEEMPFFTSIKHLLLFPFINIQDLAPWSLLIVFLFSKKAIRAIRNHPFLVFIALTFMANIWVYWVSPDNRPRYLFMLFPLFLTIIVYLYFQFKGEYKKLDKGLYYFFGLLLAVITLGMLIPPFYEETKHLNHVFLKSILLFAAMLTTVVCYLRFKQNKLILLTIGILLVRIGFNWFVMVPRHETSRTQIQKEYAYKVAELTKGEPLYVLDWTPVNHNITFYIEQQRQDILYNDRDTFIDKGVYYITSDHYLENREHEKYYTFFTEYQNTRLHLVKFNANFDLENPNNR